MRMHPPTRPVGALLALVVCACACVTPSLAQTQQPAKPAAKAAAKPAAKPAPAAEVQGKTLSLPSASGASAPQAAGPVRKGLMDREELRTCLAGEASIRARLADTAAQRGPLEAEKQAIAVEQLAFREERTALDTRQRLATDGLNTKFKEFAAKVEASNARVTAFNEKKGAGPAYERERVQINAEREAFEKERVALEAEKVTVIDGLKSDVAAYNAKAAVLDQRVVDWNQRNAKTNESSAVLEGDRSDWVASCSNRRYREDDETAIRNGK